MSTAAGNVAAAGITTLVIGYDTGSTPPSPGTLDIIANGVGSNVFNRKCLKNKVKKASHFI